MAKALEHIHEPIRKLAVPVDQLKPYPGNARRGDLSLIVDSLETHGQYKPITVRVKTNEVLAGNHTLAAAQQLGWKDIAVTFVDVDDDQAARIVLVDNRTSDLATYDDEALTELLQSISESEAGMKGTGFTDSDLSALLASIDDHDWDGEDLQDTLDDADKSLWPVLRIQVEPSVAERFRSMEGETDEEKFLRLLTKAGV